MRKTIKMTKIKKLNFRKIQYLHPLPRQLILILSQLGFDLILKLSKLLFFLICNPLSLLQEKTVEMLERKTQDTHTNESKSFQAN
jgi:hypothetical protein